MGRGEKRKGVGEGRGGRTGEGRRGTNKKRKGDRQENKEVEKEIKRKRNV